MGIAALTHSSGSADRLRLRKRDPFGKETTWQIVPVLAPFAGLPTAKKKFGTSAREPWYQRAAFSARSLAGPKKFNVEPTKRSGVAGRAIILGGSTIRIQSRAAAAQLRNAVIKGVPSDVFGELAVAAAVSSPATVVEVWKHALGARAHVRAFALAERLPELVADASEEDARELIGLAGKTLARLRDASQNETIASALWRTTISRSEHLDLVRPVVRRNASKLRATTSWTHLKSLI